MIYMLQQVLNVMILIVNYLVIDPISMIFIHKFVMLKIQLINNVYLRVELIVLRITLYPALMNMWKSLMTLLVMTSLRGGVLVNLNLGKFVYRWTNLSWGALKCFTVLPAKRKYNAGKCTGKVHDEEWHDSNLEYGKPSGS